MNRKHIICIFLLIPLSFTAHSQVIIGLLFGDKLNKGPIEFGLNVTNSFNTITSFDEVSRLNRTGFGLYIDYNFAEKWKLGTSVFFKASRGARKIGEEELLYSLPETFQNGTISRKTNYLELPVEIFYKMTPQLFLGAGFSVAYLKNAKDIIKKDIENGTGRFEQSVTTNLKRWDFGLQSHIRYQFKGDPGIQIAFGYLRGVTNMNHTGPSGVHDAIQISGLIPIMFADKK